MISDQARLENVLSRMKDNMDGRITAVCVLDNPYFTDSFIKSVKPENLIEYATHSVVDQVLIICQVSSIRFGIMHHLLSSWEFQYPLI